MAVSKLCPMRSRVIERRILVVLRRGLKRSHIDCRLDLVISIIGISRRASAARAYPVFGVLVDVVPPFSRELLYASPQGLNSDLRTSTLEPSKQCLSNRSGPERPIGIVESGNVITQFVE